jgi:hypothetical protein
MTEVEQARWTGTRLLRPDSCMPNVPGLAAAPFAASFAAPSAIGRLTQRR